MKDMVSGMFMIGVALILCAANFRAGGFHLVLDGLGPAWILLKRLWVPLVLMFIITGQAQIVIGRHMEVLKLWLAGEKGIFGCFAAGIFSPGGITVFPIVKNMWEMDMSKRALLAFLVSTQVVNWQMMMFRLPVLGWTITGILFLIGFGYAVLFAILMMIV
jgi:uncharacterized membrane protein YraQ (UPF0718 family)